MDGTRALLLTQHARLHTSAVGNADWSHQDSVLRGVPEPLLRVRPQPTLNSLAWLLWHITRGEEIAINLIIAPQSQVLDNADWAAHLGVSRRDFGTGMTTAEVNDFNIQIHLPALLAYRAAVGRQTQATLRDLPLSTLDEPIDGVALERATAAGAFGPHAAWVPAAWREKPKGFVLTVTTFAHTHLHLGEADVLRGLLGVTNR